MTVSLSSPTLAGCLFGVLFLCGCATSPAPSPPPLENLPASWSGFPDYSSPNGWLADFQSPELEQLIAEALGGNPEIEAATARLAQSLAESRMAGADRRPTAGLGLGGSRRQISTFGPTSTGGVIFENYELDLNISWEVDLWGRLRDRAAASLARLQLSEAELTAAQLSIAAQTAKEWLHLLEAKEQIALSERTAQAYRDNQKTLEARFQRGLTEGFDLRRIRTQTASAEADLSARRATLDQTIRSLEVILGRYPSASLTATATRPTLPEKIPTGLPSELLQRRPDLIAAERQLAAAEQELGADRKERLPQISLTTSGGTASQDFRNLLNNDFSVWTLAGNLTQPLFQGGRIRANIERSRALRDQAAANYRDTALRAFLEVETLLAAEKHLRMEATQLALAAEEASAAESMAWERYRQGTGDLLATLDAQRTADSARARLVTTSHRLLRNRIDLYLALGGPFDANTTQNSASPSHSRFSSLTEKPAP